jgi:hypothetical protein
MKPRDVLRIAICTVDENEKPQGNHERRGSYGSFEEFKGFRLFRCFERAALAVPRLPWVRLP